MTKQWYDIFGEEIKRSTGRPTKFPIQYEPDGSIMDDSKRSYYRTGYLVSRVRNYKQNYGLNHITKEMYLHQSEEALLKLLESITQDVLKVKNARFEARLLSKITQTKTRTTEPIST